MDFKTITIIMFQNKQNWKNVTDDDKDKLFFIFNRFMSKNYPKQSQQFNVKGIDKATAMDIWFQFLRTQVRVPNWFWKGPTKKKDPPIKEWQLLQEWQGMRLQDIYLLCEMFPKDVKSEISRIKLIKEEIESV